MKQEQKRAYKITGGLPDGDNTKTIVLEEKRDGVYSKNDAMDYAAMFFSIDPIDSIKEGYINHQDIFVEDNTEPQQTPPTSTEY